MAAGRNFFAFSHVLKRKMAAVRKNRNQIPLPLASQPTRPANQPTSQILTFCQPARPANQPTSQPANQPSRPPAYLGKLVHRGGSCFLPTKNAKLRPFLIISGADFSRKTCFLHFGGCFIIKIGRRSQNQFWMPFPKGMFFRLFFNKNGRRSQKKNAFPLF